VQSGRIIPYLAGVTVLTALAGGIVLRFLDDESFPTIGQGIWFALQTVTTVGYGDAVPAGSWGKVVASIVMVSGVTFISLTTATVVSAFVSFEQRRGADEAHAEDVAERRHLLEAIERVEGRLQALESKLDR
jgi:voltage-gated potassium channel